MLVYVTQGIHLRGTRIDPSKDPIELDLDDVQLLNLSKAGCVESAEARRIRAEADAMAAEIKASADKQIADQLDAIEQKSEAADAAEAQPKRRRG